MENENVETLMMEQKRALRRFVGARPRLYRLLAVPGSSRRERLVRRRSAVVIEGFPRSANSFAYHAFVMAQEGRVGHVAHHLHVPAQVLAALRWEVPALVLLRDPAEAVASLVVRNPRFSVEAALRDYVAFYEPLLPFADRFEVGLFEEVTGDFGAVVERLNRRYGTAFRPFEHTRERVKEVLRRSERLNRKLGLGEAQVSRPSQHKEWLKEGVRQELALPRHAPLLAEAERLYAVLRQAAPIPA